MFQKLPEPLTPLLFSPDGLRHFLATMPHDRRRTGFVFHFMHAQVECPA
jgi:hypothetical protein